MLTVLEDKITYQKANIIVAPTKRYTKALRALACSLSNHFSSFPSRSFSSSILIVLYIKGRAAMDVKNTIIRLACDLKIQRLRKIDTLQKTAPSKRSLEGLCSALKGVIKDSRTMLLFSCFLLYKPFGRRNIFFLRIFIYENKTKTL